MVDYLKIMQQIRVNIFRLERPLQIIARRLLIFILNPPSLLQCPLHITVASLDNEHFLAVVHPVLLSPSCHISDIQEHRVLGDISLYKLLERLVIMLNLDHLLDLPR